MLPTLVSGVKKIKILCFAMMIISVLSHRYAKICLKISFSMLVCISNQSTADTDDNQPADKFVVRSKLLAMNWTDLICRHPL